METDVESNSQTLRTTQGILQGRERKIKGVNGSMWKPTEPANLGK